MQSDVVASVVDRAVTAAQVNGVEPTTPLQVADARAEKRTTEVGRLTAWPVGGPQEVIVRAEAVESARAALGKR